MSQSFRTTPKTTEPQTTPPRSRNNPKGFAASSSAVAKSLLVMCSLWRLIFSAALRSAKSLTCGLNGNCQHYKATRLRGWLGATKFWELLGLKIGEATKWWASLWFSVATNNPQKGGFPFGFPLKLPRKATAMVGVLLAFPLQPTHKNGDLKKTKLVVGLARCEAEPRPKNRKG